jgi:hypothetical protein
MELSTRLLGGKFLGVEGEEKGATVMGKDFHSQNNNCDDSMMCDDDDAVLERRNWDYSWNFSISIQLFGEEDTKNGERVKRNLIKGISHV